MSDEQGKTRKELHAIGAINFLRSLCSGNTKCKDCRACGGLPEHTEKEIVTPRKDDVRGEFGELIDVLVCRPQKEKSSNFLNILNCLATITAGTTGYSRDPRLKAWTYLILDGIPIADSRSKKIIPACESLLGQTLLMHGLNNLFQFARSSDCKNWKDHWEFDLAINVYMAGIYKRPDLASKAYARYYDSLPRQREDSIIYQVYHGELEHFEAFRCTIKADSSDLVNKIYDARAAGNNVITPALAKIVHGEDTEIETHSPKTKKSRICQISLLIRDSDQSKRNEDKRAYSPHLKDFSARRASISDIEGAPSSLKWESQAVAVMSRFKTALLSTYKDGHDRSFLSRLFAKTPKNTFGKNDIAKSCKPVVWILDGEITFFLLLSALKTLENPNGNAPDWKVNVEDWLTAGSKTKLFIPVSEVTMEVSASFDEFTSHSGPLPLFGKDGPTQRFYALMSFVQRVCLFQNKPDYYYKNDGNTKIVVSICERILVAMEETERSQSKAEFKKTLMLLFGTGNPLSEPLQSPGAICRLPTFLLECLLRESIDIPFSLFFQPIIFESETSYHGSTTSGKRNPVPAVFVAGTFAGLEWQNMPFVPARFDLHLSTMMEAIRPAIDDEVGVIMEKELKAIDKRDELQRKKEMLESIVGPVKELSMLVSKAQSTASRINMALDETWAGFYSPEFGKAMEPLFGINLHEVPVPNSWLTEKREDNNEDRKLKEVNSTLHCPPLVRVKDRNGNSLDKYFWRLPAAHGMGSQFQLYEHWLPMLLYIFRAAGIDEETGLPEYSEFISNDPVRKLFNHSKFLEAFRSSSIKRISELTDDAAKGLACARYYGVLKLLTVDVLQQPRGIYLVQILAAIAFKTTIRGLLKFAIQKNSGRQANDMADADFEPQTSPGLANLVTIMEGETMLNSTNSLIYKVGLRGRSSAAVFLRQLGLIIELLGQPEAGQSQLVKLKEWNVTYCESENNLSYIKIQLICDNHFNEKAKDAICNYVYTNDLDYHDLRYAIRVISEATGGSPLFVKGKADDARRSTFTFLESESDNSKETFINIWLES